jgi:hypothetical protein
VSSRRLSETAGMLRASEPRESNLPLWAQHATSSLAAMVALSRNEPRESLRIVQEQLPSIETAKVVGADEGARDISLYFHNYCKTRAEFMLGDYVAAEQSARAALEARKRMQWGANFDAADQNVESVQIALALIAQNRGADATKILEPTVKRRRDAQSRNHGDMDIQAYLAISLYAQAAIDADRRAALLREAAALIDGTTAEYRNLSSTRLWRGRIAQAMRGEFPWTGRGRQ